MISDIGMKKMMDGVFMNKCMKVGDTLICKKKSEYFIDIFTPNEFYSITDIRMIDI